MLFADTQGLTRSSLGQVASATVVKVTDYGLSTNMYNRSHVTLRQGRRGEDASFSTLHPFFCKSVLACFSSPVTKVQWHASRDSHPSALR